MEDLFVTRLWMAGVVAAMIIFGLVALVGYFRSRNGNSDNNSGEGT